MEIRKVVGQLGSWAVGPVWGGGDAGGKWGGSSAVGQSTSERECRCYRSSWGVAGAGHPGALSMVLEPA